MNKKTLYTFLGFCPHPQKPALFHFSHPPNLCILNVYI